MQQRFWLQLLLAATAAAAAAVGEQPTATTAAPTTTTHSPLPIVSLFFPSSQSGSFRSLDGSLSAEAAKADAAAQAAAPWLASLARSFPNSLRTMDKTPSQSREAVSAIEELTGPLVRLATGGQPVAADVEQLIDSIPHLARSANAMKEADKPDLSSLDITALPPNVVAHVLNGGEVPGIARSDLDRVVREHLKRMSETADKILGGQTVEDVEKILPPLDKVPMEMVMTSLQGKTLPGLTSAETSKIREYYTKQLPSHMPSDTDHAAPLPESLSALGAMVRLLPPGYDVSKVPPEFIRSIMAGQVPDLSLLPPDLQAHFNAGKETAMHLVKSLNASLTEIVQQLTANVKKEMNQRSSETYDIGKVTHEVVNSETLRDDQNRKLLYTVAWVSLAIVIATIVISCLLYKMFSDPSRKAPASAPTPPAREGDAPRARVEESHAVREADATTSPSAGTIVARRRFGSPDSASKAEFASKANRFSTPKPILNLEAPEREEVVQVETESDSMFNEEYDKSE